MKRLTNGDLTYDVGDEVLVGIDDLRLNVKIVLPADNRLIGADIVPLTGQHYPHWGYVFVVREEGGTNFPISPMAIIKQADTGGHNGHGTVRHRTEEECKLPHSGWIPVRPMKPHEREHFIKYGRHHDDVHKDHPNLKSMDWSYSDHLQDGHEWVEKKHKEHL